MGPNPWLLGAELFPLKVRAKGMALTTVSDWLFEFIVAFADMLAALTNLRHLALDSMTWAWFILSHLPAHTRLASLLMDYDVRLQTDADNEQWNRMHDVLNYRTTKRLRVFRLRVQTWRDADGPAPEAVERVRACCRLRRITFRTERSPL